MKYNNKDISSLTLDELEQADWELAQKEYDYNEKLKHPKFEKLSPKPQLGEAFVKLRSEIKQEMEKRNG